MKLRKELWFGFALMAIIVLVTVVLMPWGNMTNGHLGLLMLDRKSTRLNSSHIQKSRMPSSA